VAGGWSEDGRMALHEMSRCRADLIVIRDWQMPGMRRAQLHANCACNALAAQ